jgi:hypothetical protein
MVTMRMSRTPTAMSLGSGRKPTAGVRITCRLKRTEKSRTIFLNWRNAERRARAFAVRNDSSTHRTGLGGVVPRKSNPRTSKKVARKASKLLRTSKSATVKSGRRCSRRSTARSQRQEVIATRSGITHLQTSKLRDPKWNTAGPPSCQTSLPICTSRLSTPGCCTRKICGSGETWLPDATTRNLPSAARESRWHRGFSVTRRWRDKEPTNLPCRGPASVRAEVTRSNTSYPASHSLQQAYCVSRVLAARVPRSDFHTRGLGRAVE